MKVSSFLQIHIHVMHGMPYAEETAVVLTFTCISDILAHLQNLYSTMPFNLTLVCFQIENDYPMRAAPLHRNRGLQLNNEQLYFPGNCDRIEFQMHVSPHLHIFMWSSRGLDLKHVSHSEVTSLIDKTISTVVPDIIHDPILHELVTKFQTHHHTVTCNHGRANFCRLGFPHAPCQQTTLSFSLDTISSQRGRFYETKRYVKDTMINAYNPVLLRCWCANPDVHIRQCSKLCLSCL